MNTKTKLSGFILLFLPVWALAGQVLDIRTGFHRSFSRLVVEANEHVGYEVVEDKANQAIVLRMQPIAPPLHLHEIAIEPGDVHLKRVDYEFSTPVLKVIAFLNSSAVYIKTYEMERPFRVVVDFYRAAPVKRKAKIENRKTGRENRKSESKFLQDNSEPPDSVALMDSVSISESRGDTLVTLAHSDSIQQLPAEELPKYSKPENETRKSKTRLIVTIGAAVLGANTLIVGYYLWSRKRKKRASAQKKASRKTRSSLPSRQDFAQVLMEAEAKSKGKSEDKPKAEPKAEPKIAANSIAEKTTGDAAIKIDNMIASLDDVLMVSDLLDPSRSALKAAGDLEALAAQTGLSREDLLGKDGEAFVENLKKRRSDSLSVVQTPE